MTKFQTNWSRREFIASLSALGVSAVWSPVKGWSFGELDPRVAKIVASTIGVDTHNHIDVPLNENELPGPQTGLSEEIKRSGLSAICMTFAVDYQKLVNPGDAYNRFINGLSAMDYQLSEVGLKRALTIKDIQTSHKKKKPAVIQSVEGGHFLEGKVARLEEAYQRGLRHLGLLHDNDAAVPLGDVYTNPVRYGGLTPFGADIIKECNQLGVLIDLAHADGPTIAAALKLAAHPVIISHTGLDTQLGQNPEMAKMMKPRLISKEQAKIVADSGGIIGVWTHLAETPLEYAQNIRALVDVIGVDHVCIGTDTKLTPAYRSAGNHPQGNFGQRPEGANRPPAGEQNERRQGPPPGAGGQGRPAQRIGERTNMAWQEQKEGFYYVVVDALLKTGFNQDEIAKIGGGNFLRVFEAATSK